MKHTSLTLVGVLILLVLETIVSCKVEALQEVTRLQVFYNNALDNACADALYEVVDMDSVDVRRIDYAEVTNNFYDYLALNLGLFLHSDKAERIARYTPVIMYILQDGYYYVCQNREVDNKIQGKSSLYISDFIPFQSDVENYRIFYTIEDRLVIQNRETNARYEGTYEDLKEAFHDVLPHSYKEFDTVRRMVINRQIEATMNACIKSHNMIAKRCGIQYRFSLPVVEREEWYNSVNDITMLTIFQAYPYGTKSLGTYNRVALSGARIKKSGR